MADRAGRARVVGQFPEGTALRLDVGTRRADGGRTLVGGSPTRLTRVTDAGARVVDELVAGMAIGPAPARQQLARRLIDAGLAHPVPPSPGDTSEVDTAIARVAVVIPVKDDAVALGRLLDELDHQCLTTRVGSIIVVDDGSADPAAIAAAIDGRADCLRSATSQGPGEARNVGWRSLDGDGPEGIVAFVDADVLPEPGWLAVLLAHLDDPTVAAVAPRVRAPRAGPDATVLDRFEVDRSPLDLGPRPSGVGVGHRVRYVPSATLLIRRSVLESMGGFDPALRYGEDVDLVWRIDDAGHRIRYAPDATVVHRNRAGWAALARQRFGYGSSAAALERRHPGAVPPVVAALPTLAAWTLVAAGTRRSMMAGVTVATVSTLSLVPELSRAVEHPMAESVRLNGRGTLATGRWLAEAVTRSWWPIAIIVSATSPRVARRVAVAVVVPGAIEWVGGSRRLSLPRWLAARLLDDVAYGAGVWRGCLAQRSARVLVPVIHQRPGRAPRSRKWRGSRPPG